MKLRTTVVGCLGSLLVSVAQAGPEPAGKMTPPPPPPPPSSDWEFNLTLYGWLSAVDGDMGLNGVTADASMSIKDVVDELEFGYMSYFEARHDKWGFSVDGFYAKLSADESFGRGAFTGRASLESEQASITLRALYRVLDVDDTKIDLFVGARWSYYDIDLDIDTSLGARRFNVSQDFIDPIVGARVHVDLNPKWYLQFSGDIGGFGIESDLTWQALGAVGYRCTDSFRVFLGYRAMGVDYEKDNFVVDTTAYGPVLGATITF